MSVDGLKDPASTLWRLLRQALAIYCDLGAPYAENVAARLAKLRF